MRQTVIALKWVGAEYFMPGADVILLFPAQPGDGTSYMCSSWQPVGQHGPAHVDLWRSRDWVQMQPLEAEALIKRYCRETGDDRAEYDLRARPLQKDNNKRLAELARHY